MKNKNTTRFLIWRNGKLGNTIVAIPFILELRRLYPNSYIAVVVEDLGKELLCCYPEIDELILYNKRREHKSIWANTLFVLKLRKMKFTHTFHIKRFFRNEFLSFLAGVSNRVGFRSNSKYSFLTLTTSYNENINVVQINLLLLTQINLSTNIDMSYKFYCNIKDNEKTDKYIKKSNIFKSKYIAIHCGGETFANRSMSYDMFAELIKKLDKEENIIPILINAPSDEKAIQEVVARLDKKIKYLIFQPENIRINANILKYAYAFIGNNSGQAHLAALVNTPTIVIYNNVENIDMWIKKWGTWGNYSEKMVVDNDKSMDIIGEIIEKIRNISKI